jgi:hypothetical protein
VVQASGRLTGLSGLDDPHDRRVRRCRLLPHAALPAAGITLTELNTGGPARARRMTWRPGSRIRAGRPVLMSSHFVVTRVAQLDRSCPAPIASRTRLSVQGRGKRSAHGQLGRALDNRAVTAHRQSRRRRGAPGRARMPRRRHRQHRVLYALPLVQAVAGRVAEGCCRIDAMSPSSDIGNEPGTNGTWTSSAPTMSCAATAQATW